MIVLIDNGHGRDTSGKCSPDKRLLEYLYAREIARRVEKGLAQAGIEVERIVREDRDVPLPERCRRVNAVCDKYGKENVMLISIHCNAAGDDGKWKSAGGWSVWTSPGKTKADDIATALWNAANASLGDYISGFEKRKAEGAYDSKQKPMRGDWSDGDPDYEAKFHILLHTKCAAVLTESLFQDNKADCEFLLSEAGMTAIADLHIQGIKNYLKTQKK